MPCTIPVTDITASFLYYSLLSFLFVITTRTPFPASPSQHMQIALTMQFPPAQIPRSPLVVKQSVPSAASTFSIPEPAVCTHTSWQDAETGRRPIKPQWSTFLTLSSSGLLDGTGAHVYRVCEGPMVLNAAHWRSRNDEVLAGHSLKHKC